MPAQLKDDFEPAPLYFDYQASSPVDPAVVTAMEPYVTEHVGNPHSAEHVFGQRAHQAIEGARSQVASLIGSDPEDVIFTSGATEANNLAILGVARNDLVRRDTILVSSIEHSAVLEPARHCGLRVVSIGVDRDGFVDEEHLRADLNERVRLVSIGWVNNEIGTVQNIVRLSEMIRAAGALMHVDGAQALTAVRVDVSGLPIDLLSLSSHKSYGPKGVGALYIAPGQAGMLQPLFYGGGQERGLRSGTLPTPLCVGFGAACSILKSKGADERGAIRGMRDRLFSMLCASIKGVAMVGAAEQRHPGNLSLRLPVEDTRDVIQLLSDRLACSSGSACHSGTELPSHVLLATGMTVGEARRVMRMGVGRFTTEEECRRAVVMLGEAVERFRA